jgi:elongation factor P hydroxylase
MATNEREQHNASIKLTEILDGHLQEFRAGHTHIVYEQVMQLITQAVTEARTEELSGALDVAFNADTQQEYIDYLEGRLQAQLKGEK